MNRVDSPEYKYDYPNVETFEMQDNLVYDGVSNKSDLNRSVNVSYNKKKIPESSKFNCNKVIAAFIVVTCLNILLALIGLVIAVYPIVKLQLNMEVSTENSEIGIVQMLFADVNATQYISTPDFGKRCDWANGNIQYLLGTW